MGEGLDGGWALHIRGPWRLEQKEKVRESWEGVLGPEFLRTLKARQRNQCWEGAGEDHVLPCS